MPLQMKGFVFRGFLVELDRGGLLPGVLESVPEDTRALLVPPPLANAWIEGEHVNRIGESVCAAHGALRWRRIAHDATLNYGIPILRSAVEGVLRLFGASPSMMFSRM